VDKLKEKIQEILKHIHAITELEAQENQTKINPDTEISEQDFMKIANKLEGKRRKTFRFSPLSSF